jgi:hypothetical protein
VVGHILQAVHFKVCCQYARVGTAVKYDRVTWCLCQRDGIISKGTGLQVRQEQRLVVSQGFGDTPGSSHH